MNPSKMNFDKMFYAIWNNVNLIVRISKQEKISLFSKSRAQMRSWVWKSHNIESVPAMAEGLLYIQHTADDTHARSIVISQLQDQTKVGCFTNTLQSGGSKTEDDDPKAMPATIKRVGGIETTSTDCVMLLVNETIGYHIGLLVIGWYDRCCVQCVNTCLHISK